MLNPNNVKSNFTYIFTRPKHVSLLIYICARTKIG